ncbi:hypothetical protein K402DRAFT_331524 [Aulographum hederae CBS 113979]|uniref:HSF-type DNA-binding domain-containing protein n=1 Tax=Aulographum hederae CBS 113979 TaxID=1176131 RepID=A0A6G1H1X1_9PEZI|nr:hypothetical protein K402DRAFT_331524 [Aulographum hederae CBS 113979]
MEAIRRSPFSAEQQPGNLHHTSIPILPSTSNSLQPPDRMDITPSSTSMGPPSSSPAAERIANGNSQGETESAPGNTNGGPAPSGAAAAVQQPKMVQTAFIHKLYSMLEDQSIAHLISWTPSNDSFIVSPCNEFARVLSSYFKHTNISSFVRQLNMYGFHKVSDVFQNGSTDQPLWEFKHGNGSFRRGDLVSLREIKRRASRQTLIHRDSFSSQRPNAPSAASSQPVEPMTDSVEARLSALETSLWETHSRLSRSEESNVFLTQRYSVLTEGLMRCHQWSSELTTHLLTMVPDPDNPIHKDANHLNREISRQMEVLRSLEGSPEPYVGRQHYFSGLNDNAGSISPRQSGADDTRRSSLANIGRPNAFRTPYAPHLAISPRRAYGSIGGSSSNYSPSSARAPPPPPPQHQPSMQHPMVSVTSPPTNLPRRHTSADIRLSQSWQGGTQGNHPHPPPNHSPYASGANSTNWPSSPNRLPVGLSGGPPGSGPGGPGGDQDLRNALAQYDLPRASARASDREISRHASPPPPHQVDPHDSRALGHSLGVGAGGVESGWQLPGAKYPFRGFEQSGSNTRRSSMASNVHSLLNPADTAEREDEEGPLGGAEERKRKRIV